MSKSENTEGNKADKSPTGTPRSRDESTESIETSIRTADSMLRWSQQVKETKGDFPLVRLTPEFLQLCGGASNKVIEMQPVPKEEAAVRLEGFAALGEVGYGGSGSTSTSSSFKMSRAEIAKRYPGANEKRRMAPATETLKYHTFETERRKMANFVKLGQKLKPFNPLPPLDPEKVMPWADWPGNGDEEVQVDVKDWGEEGSHLLYQAILFRNQADVNTLRDKRELLSDPCFYILKSVVKDLAL